MQLKATRCEMKNFRGNTEAYCWQGTGAGILSIHLGYAARAEDASISVPKEALTLPLISQLFTWFLVAQAVRRISDGSQACPPSHSSPCTTLAHTRPGTEPAIGGPAVTASQDRSLSSATEISYGSAS